MKIYKNTVLPYNYICSGYVSSLKGKYHTGKVIGTGSTHKKALMSAFKIINRDLLQISKLKK